MNINKQIIDQRLFKVVEENPEWFDENHSQQTKREHAFIALGLAAFLNIEVEEAIAHICDGSGDGGIDAIYIGEVTEDEFTVCVLQSKYSANLDKDKGFPLNEIIKLASTVESFFDPQKEVTFNQKVRERMAEIRSLILGGYIPNVRIVCLNNGKKWGADGDEKIQGSVLKNDQVEMNYLNHDDILQTLKEAKPINSTLHLKGEATIESFDFKRVLIGKVPVSEIARLIEEHGDFLLEKNIRRYLGIHKNHVNSKIRSTLIDDSEQGNFYFYNNGITMLCRQFRHNQLQEANWQVKVSDLQIINGGQTSKTIEATLAANPNTDFSKAFVMVRLYELSEDDAAAQNLTTNITIATNSQSPVDLRDLRANDVLQKNLTIQAKDLGFDYITKRSGAGSSGASKIPSSVAAEAIFAVWKRRPNNARFRRTELFGKYYEEVFKRINGAQMIIAVLIFRYCDAARKREQLVAGHPHVAYSAHFSAMRVGGELLQRCNLDDYTQIDHRNFEEVRLSFEENKEGLLEEAVKLITDILPNHLPTSGVTDLRKLSAIFRRGDLVSDLS